MPFINDGSRYSSTASAPTQNGPTQREFTDYQSTSFGEGHRTVPNGSVTSAAAGSVVTNGSHAVTQEHSDHRPTAKSRDAVGVHPSLSNAVRDHGPWPSPEPKRGQDLIDVHRSIAMHLKRHPLYQAK